MRPEAWVELPSPLVPVTAVRSTLLQASLESLKQRNHFERYRALLAAEYHEIVLHTLAPTWLPIAAAVAHYESVERLELPESEQVDMGSDVGRRIQRSALSTIARASKAAGVTPWLGLSSINRLWLRLMQGGGAQVLKIGPKDATIVFEGVPLARFQYFRNGMCGLIQAAADLFSNRAYVRTVSQGCGPTRMEYRLSWA